MERRNCDVFIPDGTTCYCDFFINGNLVAGENVTAAGLIIAGGSVVFGKNADVQKIRAGADIVLGDGSTAWVLQAEGDVSLGKNCEVVGYIEAAWDVDLGEGTTTEEINAELYFR